MAFYSLPDVQDRESCMSPNYIPRNRDVVNDGAPRERWSLDVLSEDGEAEIRRVADEIKAECQPLW